jgi:phage terminase Nu1 subunit (DNA packaging protein)
VFPLPIKRGGCILSDDVKKIDNVEQVTVSSTVLSNLFGLTTRRIRQLENEGVIQKIARGKYSLQDNIKSYITYIKASADLKENKTEEGKIDYDEEHALLERRKREKMELELAAMRGTMHYSEDVERVMNDMLSNFKAKILALPSRAAPRLITLSTIADIQEVLQNEVLDALNEMSQYNPNDFYSDEYVDVLDDEVENESKEITDS